MHELSVARSIVAEVQAAMIAHDVSSVGEVTVKVGRLSGVVPSALDRGWELACRDTPLAGARLAIEEDPVVVRCPVGDHRLQLDVLRFRCDEHECATGEVLSGEALEIVRFTVGSEAPSGVVG